MSSEFKTVAWVDDNGRTVQIPVTVRYEELAGKPIVYGVFHGDKDVTWELAKDEYALIYQKVGAHILESMTEAAEIAAEGER